MTQHALARMVEKGESKIDLGVSPDKCDEIRHKLALAQKYAEENPRQHLKQVDLTKMSKRVMTRLIRSDERQKAAAHKEYDSVTKRAQYLAQSRALAEIDREKKKWAKNMKSLQKANSQLKRENSTLADERAQLEALYVKRYRSATAKRFARELCKDDKRELQKIALEQRKKSFQILLAVDKFMGKYPKVKKIFEEYVEVDTAEREKKGPELMEELHKMVTATPQVYLGDNHREVLQRYEEKYLAKGNISDDEISNAMDIYNEVDDIMEEANEMEVDKVTGKRKRSSTIDSLLDFQQGQGHDA